MDLNLSDLFMIEPIHGGSVNGWVYIPPSFVIMIYCAAIIITAVSVAYLVKKKNPPLQALKKSIVIAFFCSGFLYLVYSERTWYTWFSHDVETYSGLSIEEKTRIEPGSIYDFAMVAQKVLKDNEYTLYSSSGNVSLIAQYYLLPRRNRANARNILVFDDADAAYDYGTKTFIRGDRRIENAEMLYWYDYNAYILRAR